MNAFVREQIRSLYDIAAEAGAVLRKITEDASA
jgi:hypothetical protein